MEKYYSVGTTVAYGTGKITDPVLCRAENPIQAARVCEVLNTKDNIIKEHANRINDMQTEQIAEMKEHLAFSENASKKIKELENVISNYQRAVRSCIEIMSIRR